MRVEAGSPMVAPPIKAPGPHPGEDLVVKNGAAPGAILYDVVDRKPRRDPVPEQRKVPVPAPGPSPYPAAKLAALGLLGGIAIGIVCMLTCWADPATQS
jgi:hypothetical protein